MSHVHCLSITCCVRFVKSFESFVMENVLCCYGYLVLGHNSGMIAVNEHFMVMVDYKVLHIFCNII